MKMIVARSRSKKVGFKIGTGLKIRLKSSRNVLG